MQVTCWVHNSWLTLLSQQVLIWIARQHRRTPSNGSQDSGRSCSLPPSQLDLRHVQSEQEAHARAWEALKRKEREAAEATDDTLKPAASLTRVDSDTLKVSIYLEYLVIASDPSWTFSWHKFLPAKCRQRGKPRSCRSQHLRERLCLAGKSVRMTHQGQ